MYFIIWFIIHDNATHLFMTGGPRQLCTSSLSFILSLIYVSGGDRIFKVVNICVCAQQLLVFDTWRREEGVRGGGGRLHQELTGSDVILQTCDDCYVYSLRILPVTLECPFMSVVCASENTSRRPMWYLTSWVVPHPSGTWPWSALTGITYVPLLWFKICCVEKAG